MAGLLKIRINTADFRRIRKALIRMQAIVEAQKTELPRTCAEDFKLLLIRNIVTQNFVQVPYSERYAHWKHNIMGIHKPFWQLYGDLLNNITFFADGNGFVGGVRKGIRDGGGKSWFSSPYHYVGESKEVAAYGAEVEKKRPVFGPTNDQYRQDGFPVRGRAALLKIGAPWRGSV